MNIRLHKFLLLSTLLIIVIGCNKKENNISIINKLSSKFPQLKASFQNQSGNYQLIRSVSFGEQPILIELYAQPHSFIDPQQIIIVTNAAHKSYAFPFFSNTFHDYWNFMFDSINSTQKRTNTTFEKELNTCLDTLKLNDSLGTAGKVIDELINSVLHCREIELSDSTQIRIGIYNDKSLLENENTDSCNKRMAKNWESISTEILSWNNTPYFYTKFYLDKSNDRIYKFNYVNIKRKKPYRFVISTFRQDCVQHFISM